MDGVGWIGPNAPIRTENVDQGGETQRPQVSTGGHDPAGRSVTFLGTVGSGASGGAKLGSAPGFGIADWASRNLMGEGEEGFSVGTTITYLPGMVIALAGGLLGLAGAAVGGILGTIGGALTGIGRWLFGSTRENRSDAAANTANNFGSAGQALVNAQTNAGNAPMRVPAGNIRILTPEEVQKLRDEGVLFVQSVAVSSPDTDSAFELAHKHRNFVKDATIAADES
ncbi:hypothetical protein ACUSIJ_00310 [Pseudochelatococcus sp. B33]